MADKALCVGINAYPSAPLSGCLTDMNDWANYIVDEHKFKPDNVRLIADGRADTYGIKQRLWWLVDVNPGDRVFFQYSGHGAQYPTRDGKQELDGLLEVICPIDFNWKPEHMITDKDFVQIFSRMPSGVKFYWVSDSCHSGDLTREMPKPGEEPKKSRAYPVPPDIAWRGRGAAHKKIDKTDRAMVCGQLDVGFVSGCRSNQTSADAVINGQWHGALSYYLLQNLRKLKGQPLNKVVAATSNDLAKAGYSQRPQVEGARAKKPLFG